MLGYFYIHYDLEIHMDNCVRNIKRVYSKLEKYLENPTEESIHDMRTTLRRLESTYQSSPKKIRNNKKMRAFNDTGKHLFKINSKIRDIDIILRKLSTDGKMTEEQLEPFEHSLTQERDRQLVEARKVALELQDITVPKIYDKDEISRKLEKKFRQKITKNAGRLKVNIEKKTPLVISDVSNVGELHEVRKDTKKLRYLIELILPKDHDKSDNNTIKNNINASHKEMSYEILEHLEKIQKMLGDIHDYDIVIDYLNQNTSNKTAVSDTLKNIVRNREIKYMEFVDYAKSRRLISSK
ncbi:CHAD domain-containing protein [Candidatus Nitrosocosmicus sp. SS]|nr:CHAD domain-containing protein [Candidatus Nitrosocosmicus sp. SS]